MSLYMLAGKPFTGIREIFPGKAWLFWRGRKIVRVPVFMAS